MAECEGEHRRRLLVLAGLAEHAPTPLSASSSSEIAAEACACSSAARNVRLCLLARLPSASAAKPIRQSAAIMPQRWLTSLNAS